jgi:hypothetical protein
MTGTQTASAALLLRPPLQRELGHIWEAIFFAVKLERPND